MKATIDDENYQINWRHYHIDMEHFSGATACNIDLLDKTGSSIRNKFGTALCSVKDQYNNNTGRKVSLARALAKSGFSKKQKKQVWDAYFKMRNGKY